MRVWLASLALVALAASAPTLDAGGLGAVRVGMTLAQASRALGVKLRLAADPGYSSDECDYAYRVDKRDGGVSYMVAHGRIVRIDVVKPGVTTRLGIGVGSKIAAIRAAYPRIKSEPNRYSEEPEFEWQAPGGKSGLIFGTEKGRVSYIWAGRYPELSLVEGCS